MAQTLSTLRTRLARRLSIGTLSTALSSALDEAINEALFRLATMDSNLGINQLHIIGETWGNLTTTASAASQGDTSFTYSGETLLSKNVFHGDIVEFGSKRFLITSVTNTTTGIGSPLGAAISGGAATIYRRTIKLPYAGIVNGVTAIGSNNEAQNLLKGLERAALHRPISTNSDPEAYSVAYDKSNDATYLSLFPAPTSVKRFMIKTTEVPTRLTNNADELDWPETHLDGLVEAAREAAIRGFLNQSDVVMNDAAKGRIHSLHSFQDSAGMSGLLSPR